MSARLWPADAVTGAPSYTGRALRQTTVAPYVAMGSSARPLGAKSGIRLGTPSSIVSATSTTWTVQPFAGVIDGESAAIAGPYAYSFDTNQTGAVTAAAGSARIDRLDVQVSDPAESDGSSVPSIAIIYTAGTAGAGVPAAAPARTHKLCLINVPASGGGSPTVSWAPDWSGDPGEWTFNTLSEATAYATAIGTANVPVQQQAAIIADTPNNGNWWWHPTLLTWVGGWQAFTTTWGAAGATPAIGNGTLTARYRWIDVHTISLRIAIVFGSTTTGGTQAWSFTLPAGPTTAAVGEQILQVKAFTAGNLNWVGVAPVSAGSTSANTFQPYLPASSSIANLLPVQNANAGGSSGTGVPAISGQFSFITGSNCVIEGILEVA